LNPNTTRLSDLPHTLFYTFTLLRLISKANNSTLGMYMDDDIIFAYAKEWPEVNHHLYIQYTEC